VCAVGFLPLLTQKRIFSPCNPTRPLTIGTEHYWRDRILVTKKMRHSNDWKLRDNRGVDRNTKLFFIKKAQSLSCSKATTEGCAYTYNSIHASYTAEHY